MSGPRDAVAPVQDEIIHAAAFVKRGVDECAMWSSHSFPRGPAPGYTWSIRDGAVVPSGRRPGSGRSEPGSARSGGWSKRPAASRISPGFTGDGEIAITTDLSLGDRKR
jgi:hypothetical protein